VTKNSDSDRQPIGRIKRVAIYYAYCQSNILWWHFCTTKLEKYHDDGLNPLASVIVFADHMSVAAGLTGVDVIAPHFFSKIVPRLVQIMRAFKGKGRGSVPLDFALSQTHFRG